jgi:hypothetical protein
MPCSAGLVDKNDRGTCKKMMPYIPSYCPQQMIFGMYKNIKEGYLKKSVSLFKDVVKGVLPRTVNDAIGFERYVDDINGYYNGCANTSEYDFVAQSVCNRVDMDFRGDMYESLANMCASTYCGRGGENGIGCMKLDDLQNNPEKGIIQKLIEKDFQKDDNNVTKGLILSTIMCVIVYAFIMIKKRK